MFVIVQGNFSTVLFQRFKLQIMSNISILELIFINHMYNQAGKMDQKQHNILIVSHGLPIRQLIKILFEEFECVSKVPGLNNPTELLVAKKFRESCLNTSWSRFVIEVTGENHDNIKSAECREVFCIPHLNEFFTIW